MARSPAPLPRFHPPGALRRSLPERRILGTGESRGDMHQTGFDKGSSISEFASSGRKNGRIAGRRPRAPSSGLHRGDGQSGEAGFGSRQATVPPALRENGGQRPRRCFTVKGSDKTLCPPRRITFSLTMPKRRKAGHPSENPESRRISSRLKGRKTRRESRERWTLKPIRRRRAVRRG